MTHQEITNGLAQLGFTTGWVITGEKITLWENSEPQPTNAEILKAAASYQMTLNDNAAKAAAPKLAIAERLGLSPEDLATLLS
jgi:MOSC domain-containing protein YiiM